MNSPDDYRVDDTAQLFEPLKHGRNKQGLKTVTRMNKSDPTEATLEARIHGALQRAFPFLAESELEHQTTFSIRLGRRRISLDLEEKELTEHAIADILVKYRKKPIAIMELKRPGRELTSDDDEQGLSYARLMTPQAPLVVVTNGQLVVSWKRTRVKSGYQTKQLKRRSRSW